MATAALVPYFTYSAPGGTPAAGRASSYAAAATAAAAKQLLAGKHCSNARRSPGTFAPETTHGGPRRAHDHCCCRCYCCCCCCYSCCCNIVVSATAVTCKSPHSSNWFLLFFLEILSHPILNSRPQKRNQDGGRLYYHKFYFSGLVSSSGFLVRPLCKTPTPTTLTTTFFYASV